MGQEIELYISEEGEIKVHIKGIKGAGCLKVLDALNNHIGSVKDKELTSEYYQKDEERNIPKNKIKKK